MKISDLAFAATLGTMLLASLTAVASLGLRSGATDEATPTFRLEPVVITGTRSRGPTPGAAKAQVADRATSQPRPQDTAQKRV